MGTNEHEDAGGKPVLSDLEQAQQAVEQAADRLRFVENEVAAGRMRGYWKEAEAREQLEQAQAHLAELDAGL